MKDKESNVTKDQKKKSVKHTSKLNERKMYRHMDIDESVYKCVIS